MSGNSDMAYEEYAEEAQMKKKTYHVHVIQTKRVTNTYVIVADNQTAADDAVFEGKGVLLSTNTKHIDSDSWIEEIDV